MPSRNNKNNKKNFLLFLFFYYYYLLFFRFAMKDQRPDEFSEYKKLTDNFSELLTNGKLTVFIKKTIERAANALKDPELRQMMLDFRYRYGEMLDEIFAMKSCDPFGVVGHGDSWNNNFLFQYNDNVSPVDRKSKAIMNLFYEFMFFNFRQIVYSLFVFWIFKLPDIVRLYLIYTTTYLLEQIKYFVRRIMKIY